MADIAHERTEEILNDLRERIAEEYAQAVKDMQEKYIAWAEQFAEQEAKQKALLEAGKITQDDYNNWRFRHEAIGKRWEKMRDVLAEDLENARNISLKISGEKMPDVYALNANFATWQIEHDGSIDTGFTLYNHDAAEYLLADTRQLMPGPSTKKALEIAADKAMQWDKQKIQSAVLQGILQGESVYKVAERLRGVAEMDYNASVRYARTMTTSAQNAGRYESFRRAKKIGVDLTIEWQATLDDRTRAAHRYMHGQRTTVDEPFNTPDGYTIYYPADCTGESDAPQREIWNCRCTLLAWVKGFEGDTVKSSPKMEDKSFDEWQNEKSGLQSNKSNDKIKSDKSITGSRQAREKREKRSELNKETPKSIDDANVVSWVKPINGSHTRAQDIIAVNPNYSSSDAFEWHNNCQRCVTTYEARRRGYDVTALPCYSRSDKYASGSGFTLPYIKGDRKVTPLWFADGLTITQTKTYTMEQCKASIDRLMQSYGDGARAVISGYWSSGNGHVFIAENIGGEIHFFDPQNGQMNCKSYFEDFSPRSTSIFRIDDLPFNDNIKDVFRNDIE